MCLYNKTLEVESSDKGHFWHNVWGAVPDVDNYEKPAFCPGDTVHRLEFRFHHTVIEQFERHLQAEGKADSIRTYADLAPHLSGLWLYALNNFRLMEDKGYIHPLWQVLAEDVRFFHTEPLFCYKREYKKADVVVGRRHVAHYLGNYIKLAARKNLNPDLVVSKILNDALEQELCDYFGIKRFGDSDLLPVVLREFVGTRMMQHRMNGVGVWRLESIVMAGWLMLL